jgi:hypothetical protein
VLRPKQALLLVRVLACSGATLVFMVALKQPKIIQRKLTAKSILNDSFFSDLTHKPNAKRLRHRHWEYSHRRAGGNFEILFCRRSSPPFVEHTGGGEKCSPVFEKTPHHQLFAGTGFI